MIARAGRQLEVASAGRVCVRACLRVLVVEAVKCAQLRFPAIGSPALLSKVGLGHRLLPGQSHAATLWSRRSLTAWKKHTFHGEPHASRGQSRSLQQQPVSNLELLHTIHQASGYSCVDLVPSTRSFAPCPFLSAIFLVHAQPTPRRRAASSRRYA